MIEGRKRLGGPGTASSLVADIEARIADGVLLPGERLEPVRAVAESLGMAPNTVAAAYRTLGERGFLIGKGRRGTFVAPRPPVLVAAEQPVPAGLINLASGNPDLALLPEISTALTTMSAEHVLYGTPAMEPELAALFARNLAEDSVDPSHLAIVGGALDGIERVLNANLRPGDMVAVEDPGYAAVRELVAAMRLRAVPVAMDHRGPVPASVEVAIRAGVAALIVTPRAQNPTGAALDAERAAELSALLAEAPEVLVIEDDHAGDVAGWDYHGVVPESAGRWAMVRSVAKSLGPDFRLAVLAADETTVRRVSGRQALGVGWVSHLLQRAVVEVVSDPVLPALLSRAASVYARRREAFIAPLNAAGLNVRSRSGLNVWVPVDDEAHVMAGMQQQGFAVRSGSRFRHHARPGVRVSTGGSDIETLHAAATALLATAGSIVPTRTV